MHRLRGKLTYANVISTLCLVLLLGGGSAYAASRMLPRNSVGTSQIRAHAVTPAKLSAAASAALTGWAGPQGAQGAPGKEGPEGRQGPEGKEGPEGAEGKEGLRGAAGATDVVVRYAETSTPDDEAGNALATCRSGEVATGGGAEVYAGTGAGVDWFQPGGVPYPSAFSTPGEEPVPDAWYAHWYNESGATDHFRVFVVCASP